MADMKKANAVYSTVIKAFKELDWTYDEYKDDLVVVSGVKSEDLPIKFMIHIYAENQVIRLLSTLPFDVTEDKRIDLAIAVNHVNCQIIDGSFDYDIQKGEISFRMTSSYMDSVISTELIKYMISIAAGTIDQYNDKLYFISEGKLSIREFMDEND